MTTCVRHYSLGTIQSGYRACLAGEWFVRCMTRWETVGRAIGILTSVSQRATRGRARCADVSDGAAHERRRCRLDADPAVDDGRPTRLTMAARQEPSHDPGLSRRCSGLSCVHKKIAAVELSMRSPEVRRRLYRRARHAVAPAQSAQVPPVVRRPPGYMPFNVGAASAGPRWRSGSASVC